MGKAPTKTDTFEGWINFWHEGEDAVAALTPGLDKAVEAGVLSSYLVGKKVDHNSGDGFSQYYLRIVLPEAKTAEHVTFWEFFKANSGLVSSNGSLYADSLGKGCFPADA